LTLKIGVISPKLPNVAPKVHAPVGSSFFWFSEIEGAFAFLLHDHLDRLYIDATLIENPEANAHKYQKLIEQLHPHLENSFLALEAARPSISNIAALNYFPQLDVLFKNGDVKTVFQPIVEMRADGHLIHGVECLSRFHFEGRNYAPEFIFNYAAEKLKLTNYDKICLMQALSLVPHRDNSLIFINVRPQTLISHDFCPWFRSVLKKNNLSPEQIVIEVTEQYCNISEYEMVEQCKTLRNQGIRLAVDDFGSGISNLSMLEIMRPSYIKISGRFIKNAHLDARKQKIIKNVLDLADDFGIVAIVESVELKEEWQQVMALGARLAQGFYFFQAMDRERVLDLLGKNFP